MTKVATANLRPATNQDREAVASLVTTVLQEYGLKTDPCSTDQDLSDLEFHYQRRGGRFDVLENDRGEVVGCVGLYPIDTHCVELRKMYLRKDARGKGLGKKLLDHAVKSAKEMGYKRVTLETAAVLKEAIKLYTKYGFEPFVAQHLARRCDQAFVLELD
jgi:GNAT superfamily N-acetyltransferase